MYSDNEIYEYSETILFDELDLVQLTQLNPENKFKTTIIQKKRKTILKPFELIFRRSLNNIGLNHFIETLASQRLIGMV